MKVAKCYRLDDIRVEDIPVPKIGPGEILVQVKACGLCGSDLSAWYVEKKAPTVLGHEPAGVVAEVGAEVTDFKVGDRVFVHHHVPCFTCHFCRRGHHTLCETFKTTHLDPGGFAEYCRVPRLNTQRDVLKLPPDMSFDQATLIEPAGTCIRGIERTAIQTGDTVVVIGAGPTGLIHMQLARILGAGLIVVTDLSDYRLDLARRLGADHTANANEDVVTALQRVNAGRKADVVINTAGSMRAMEQALTLADGGATILFFGLGSPEARLPVSPHWLLFSEITMVATYSCSPLETRKALKLIQGGRIHAEQLITHRFDLSGVGEAIRLAVEAKDSMKILVTP
jgi:L-iditol 2-dehydrogenase